MNKNYISLLLVVLLTACTSTPQSANTNQSSVNGQSSLLSSAARGDAKSQYMLANIYLSQRDLQHRDRAIALLKQSAHDGFAKAQFQLGYMYDRGSIVPEDNKLAAAWYQKAAFNGSVSAYNNLGIMYERGEGVNKDYIAASEWYWKAANKQHSESLNNLGLLYYLGKIEEEPDLEKGLKLLRKSAELGNVNAYNNLAVFSMLGSKEIIPDYIEGYKWAELATRKNHNKALEVKQLLSNQLTEVEKQTAISRANKWETSLNEQEIVSQKFDSPLQIIKSALRNFFIG